MAVSGQCVNSQPESRRKGCICSVSYVKADTNWYCNGHISLAKVVTYVYHLLWQLCLVLELYRYVLREVVQIYALTKHYILG